MTVIWEPVTASSKVALTAVPTRTPVLSGAGVLAVTVGGVVSLTEVWKTTSTQ